MISAQRAALSVKTVRNAVDMDSSKMRVMLIGRRLDGTVGGIHFSDGALLGLALLVIVGKELGRELGEPEGSAEASAEGLPLGAVEGR